MKLSDLILNGTEKEQEAIKTILNNQLPFCAISIIDKDENKKNEYYAKLEEIDHGLKIIITPRFEIEAVHLDENPDLGFKPVKGGYSMWSYSDRFEITNGPAVKELVIYYK